MSRLSNKPISKLKKIADRWFSLYIRLSRSTKTGRAKCVTCGSRGHWKEMHNGHFMSRRHMATRYDEQNVDIQCPRCNLYEQGEQFKFGLAIDKKWGDGTAEKIMKKSRKTVRFSKQDYIDLIETYKTKAKEAGYKY